MATSRKNLISLEDRDLDHALAKVGPLWEKLRGSRLFITGGTGFIGRWLLATLAYANQKLNLEVTATVLSRDPELFLKKVPELKTFGCFQWIQGDIRTFNIEGSQFDYVIHGATDADHDLIRRDPVLVAQTIVSGTHRALQAAAKAQAKKVLFLSSGAIYGEQPMDMAHIRENFIGTALPIDSTSTYGESKRLAELLCLIYEKQFGFSVSTARLFSVVGPHLPLEGEYAIGNFIRDAAEKLNAISVKGDGRAVRSYLYAADVAVWLWTLLLHPQSHGPYNVGSPYSIRMSDLAREVSEAARRCLGLAEAMAIRTENKATSSLIPGKHYVPSIERAETELGLQMWVSLPNALDRTLQWAIADKKERINDSANLSQAKETSLLAEKQPSV